MTSLSDLSQRLANSITIKESKQAAARIRPALAVSRASDLFILSSDSRIRCCRLRDLKLNRADVMRVLSFDQGFDISCTQNSKLLFNRCNDLLAIHNVDSVIVLALSKSTMQTSFTVNKDMMPLPVISIPVFNSDDGRAEYHSSEIVYIQWHPYSDRHLCLLLRDNSFRIFHISNSEANLEYQLDLTESSIELIPLQRRFVHFWFSSTQGWGKFTVYFLDDIGEIYLACPIVPVNMHIDAAQLADLDGNITSGIINIWIQSCWQPLLATNSYLYNPSQLMPKFSTYLQGPLRPDFVSNEIHTDASSLIGFSIPHFNTDVLFTAFRSGHMNISLLCKPLMPSWLQKQNVNGDWDLLMISRFHMGSSDLNILSRNSDSIFVESSEAISQIQCFDLLRLLAARAQGSNQSLSLSHLHPPVRQLLRCPQKDRMDIQFCNDPLIGQYMLALLSKYEVVVQPISASSKADIQASPPHQQIEDSRVSFSIEALDAGDLPELSLSSLDTSSMSNISSSSLQSLINFSKQACSAANVISSQQSLYNDRYHLLQKFFQCQLLYVSRVKDILSILEQRQAEIQVMFKERCDSMQKLLIRVEQCAHSVKNWNNGILPTGERLLSSEEVDFALELQRSADKMKQYREMHEEIVLRLNTVKGKPQSSTRQLAPLAETGLNRIRPVLERHTNSLKDCQSEIQRLHNRMQSEFSAILQ